MSSIAGLRGSSLSLLGARGQSTCGWDSGAPCAARPEVERVAGGIGSTTGGARARSARSARFSEGGVDGEFAEARTEWLSRELIHQVLHHFAPRERSTHQVCCPV